MRHIYIIITVLAAFALGLSTHSHTDGKGNAEDKTHTVRTDTMSANAADFYYQEPVDGLMAAMEYYGVHHRDIVYAQAVLETGNFKSRNCTVKNNLFGLYDSKNGRYYEFGHWADCVVAYKEWIQHKYNSGEDYYSFLNRICYAEDTAYNDILRKIVVSNRKKINKTSHR